MISYQFNVGDKVRINGDLLGGMLVQLPHETGIGVITNRHIGPLGTVCYAVNWCPGDTVWPEFCLELAEKGTGDSGRCQYEGHTAVNTGFRKTWCRACDADGEMDMSGNVKWK